MIKKEKELKRKIRRLRMLGGFITSAYFEAMDSMRKYPKAFMSFPILQGFFV